VKEEVLSRAQKKKLKGILIRGSEQAVKGPVKLVKSYSRILPTLGHS
jgi:hypothetical protein